ncbi:hypothetical protein [Brevundimonas aurantiaca]|jgi:hypothetical protein|uniref:hypothetical protein n=1 Tax=Brevundimonas aurantiaca TaxID=74316 RepID=UPI001D1804BE|nr:hypothetical protein [Brevundimonas aurantiaca]MCC4295199.1 hypothetical protein [Brevundimonas aurantiaca]
MQQRFWPYYLNSRRLMDLTGYEIPIAAQSPLHPNSGERTEAMRIAAHVARGLLEAGQLPSLTQKLIEGVAEGEMITASTWGLFTFTGLTASMRAQENGKVAAPGRFTGTLPVGSTDYVVSGELSNDHVYSDTSVGLMSNKKRVLMVGRFEVTGELIRAHPIAIGDVVQGMGILTLSWKTLARVHIEQIDTFAAARNVKPPKAAELARLREIPEDVVKAAFADIIGEPFVPKDWGGETSDLQTSQVHIEGTRVPSAFIFKGPALKGPLHPGNMGKRGDQLLRAFREPANLIVIQHCDKIENTVVTTAEAFAIDPSRPRRFCIIDGGDTWRILKAYGKI